MRPSRFLVFTLAFALGAAGLAACSSSSSSKSSTKSDTGGVTASSSPTNGTPVAIEVGDTNGVDAPETMTVSPSSVAAGPVTFTVKNTGTIKHEMVVLKTEGSTLTLNSDGKVSEAKSVGEIGDIQPGKTETLTLKLAAGQYELVCNIKDHYKMGMHAPFTVT